MIILEQLISKYEASIHSKQGTQQQTKVRLDIHKICPKYGHSSNMKNNARFEMLIAAHERNQYIDVVRHLDTIQEVSLRLDHVNEVYATLGIIPIQKARSNAITVLQGLQPQVISTYLIQQLEGYHTLKSYFDIRSSDEIVSLLNCCYAVLQNTEETSYRKFSQKVFGNSKQFESKLGTIQKLLAIIDPDLDFITEHKILKNPGFVYLKGHGLFSINKQSINLALLGGPIGISNGMLEVIQVLPTKISRIITIENLTSFHDYKAHDELVIYLGGFHNSLRGAFLKALYHVYPDLDYYHFGDIDLGGFEIYYNLIHKTQIPFKTLYMDSKTLLKYQDYGLPLSKVEQQGIRKLHSQHPLPIFELMLLLELKLEQEIVEPDAINPC